jgi:8-oxo-dGTP pyrophosphatase MutT (NUDIX family)
MRHPHTLKDDSLVQILDETGQEIPQKATADQATNQGLWQMGVHVIIWDKSTDRLLVQQRSPLIIFNPSRLDISVGGGVNQGESPEHAALREVYEEVGIQERPENLRKLFVYKYNHRHRRYRKHVKVFCHTYLLILDKTQPLRISSEVSSASFITWRQAWRLLRRHHLLSLGRLAPQYGYYRRLLTSAQEVIDGMT